MVQLLRQFGLILYSYCYETILNKQELKKVIKCKKDKKWEAKMMKTQKLVLNFLSTTKVGTPFMYNQV